MRKILLPITTLVVLLFTACQTDSLVELETEQQKTQDLQDETYASNSAGNAYGRLRSCSSHSRLKQKLKKSPGLVRKMAHIESHTRNFILSKKKKEKIHKGKKPKAAPASPQTYTIPVWVHVIYSNEAENISLAQIQSQIDVLNADFKARNREITANIVPGEFASVVASAGITFSLDITHISRKKTSRASWGRGEEMKFASSGGLDAVNPGKYLNIWVCNIGNGDLGFAQYPGGDEATDGVVISPQFFGTTGYVQAPFNQGRTTTHEIGHWLNLNHIWGDGDCSIDDGVADTPPADRPNYGCPTQAPKFCNTTSMSMNFMDYTDDACMYIFTSGQRDRMHALFSRGGARESYVSSR